MSFEAAAVNNGCLEVVHGSHKMELEFTEHGRVQESWEKKREWVAVPMQPGDLLIFGSHLVHRATENKTNEGRASL